MGETLFNPTFRIEVVIPLEIGFPSPWIESFNEDSNLKRLRTNLDLLEEVREWIAVRIATYP